MREFGAIRVQVDGDPEVAKRYLGIARTQLGITKNLMAANGLLQSSRSVTLSDGTVIKSQSVFGQDIVTIAPAAQVEQEEAQIARAVQEVQRTRRILTPAQWMRGPDGPAKWNHEAVWDSVVRRMLIYGGAGDARWPFAVFSIFTNLGVPNTAFTQGAFSDGHSDFLTDAELFSQLFPGSNVFGAQTLARFSFGDFDPTGGADVVKPSIDAVPPESSGRIFLYDTQTTYTDVTASFLTGGAHPDPIVVYNQYAALMLPAGGSDGASFVVVKMYDPSPFHHYITSGFSEELWQYTTRGGWEQLDNIPYSEWENTYLAPFGASSIGSSVGISPTTATVGDTTVITPAGVKYNFGGSTDGTVGGATGQLWIFDPAAATEIEIPA